MFKYDSQRTWWIVSFFEYTCLLNIRSSESLLKMWKCMFFFDAALSIVVFVHWYCGLIISLYFFFFWFQCQIGYTGTGRYCGLDSDLDGHPDKTLPCTVWGCNRVRFFYSVVINKNIKSSFGWQAYKQSHSSKDIAKLWQIGVYL